MVSWDKLIKTTDATSMVPKLTPLGQRALNFLAGDYWQLGQCWIGIQVPADAKDRAAVEAELERTFTPQPLIEDCAGRIVEGLLAQEPAWEWTFIEPLPELAEGQEHTSENKQKLKVLEDLNSSQGNWWDQRGVHEIAGEMVAQMIAIGRGTMRHWVPPGLLSETGKETPTGRKIKEFRGNDWKKALEKIYLEVPCPDSATVSIDRNSMQGASIFVYAVKKDDGAEVQRVEISFLNDEDQTVVRILEEDVIVDDVKQNCGGTLYVDEALMPVIKTGAKVFGKEKEGRGLVTDAVQRMQNALNVCNTMLLHNSNLAGFREYNFVNIKPPMEEVDDPTSDTGKKKVPADVEVGPGARNFLVGITYEDEDGNQKIANGNIVTSEPVDPKPLIEAKREFETGILKAFKQLYVAMGNDATASAISRVVAMVEFIQLLHKLRPKLEGVLRSRLKGVAYLAAHLANDQGQIKFLDTLRVRVDIRITPPPLSPEERRIVVELYKARLMSREFAMIMLGVEDVDGEVQKIDNDPEIQMEVMKQRAAIVAILARAAKDVTDPAKLESAAVLAGFDPKAAKRWANGETDIPVAEAEAAAA